MRRVPESNPTRRALLVGAGAGLSAALAGCSGAPATPAGSGGTPRQATRRAQAEGRELRAAAARASSGLLVRYEATAATHAELVGTLTPLRQSVTAHLEVLRRVPWPESPGALAGPGARPAVPARPPEALTALADAERAVASQRRAALANAPPALARVLAALAAAGYAHAELLGRAAA